MARVNLGRMRRYAHHDRAQREPTATPSVLTWTHIPGVGLRLATPGWKGVNLPGGGVKIVPDDEADAALDAAFEEWKPLMDRLADQ